MNMREADGYVCKPCLSNHHTECAGRRITDTGVVFCPCDCNSYEAFDTLPDVPSTEEGPF